MPPHEALPYRLNVGAVLFGPMGHVFVGRRKDMPGENWQLPQGGIDADEDPRVAILRELREEIGTDNAEILAEHPEWLHYDLPDELIGVAFRGKYRGQRQKWFALKLLCPESHIVLDADPHPEFSAWRWVPLASLPTIAVGFKRAIYEALAKDFAYLVNG